MKPWLIKLAQALSPLSGGSQSHREWKEQWSKHCAALEAVLGKREETVHHSKVPLSRGGDADVLTFRDGVAAYAYVTADLTIEAREWQLPNSLGNYELVMCTRTEVPWAPSIISRLARYTFQAQVEPGDTMDMNLGPGCSTLYFDAAERWPSFSVDGHVYGLLLCLGITTAERELLRSGGREVLMAKLTSAGHYPCSDPERGSVA
jgi:hypothetical protein